MSTEGHPEEDEPELDEDAPLEVSDANPEVAQSIWTDDSGLLQGQKKLWCIRHYTPFYGSCAPCIQEAILHYLKQIANPPPPVKKPAPTVSQVVSIKPDLLAPETS